MKELTAVEGLIVAVLALGLGTAVTMALSLWVKGGKRHDCDDRCGTADPGHEDYLEYDRPLQRAAPLVETAQWIETTTGAKWKATSSPSGWCECHPGIGSDHCPVHSETDPTLECPHCFKTDKDSVWEYTSGGFEVHVYGCLGLAKEVEAINFCDGCGKFQSVMFINNRPFCSWDHVPEYWKQPMFPVDLTYE